MSITRQQLTATVREWQEDSESDPADGFSYGDLLDDLLYQGDQRFRDYVQFEEDGPFPYRLKKWLDNVRNTKQQKVMFKLLQKFTFIEAKQMQSMYRQAYRMNVTAWISEQHMKRDDLLAVDYHQNMLTLLRQFFICSLTHSFDTSLFKKVNSLVGLPKLEMLGEGIAQARQKLEAMSTISKKKGVIVFEDMVGTGDQAAGVLRAISEVIPHNWKCLFVPLIILSDGLARLRGLNLPRLCISPVLEVPSHSCVRPKPQPGEHGSFAYARSLIKQTAERVIEPLHKHDILSSGPFGYEDSGAVLVTSHNAPDNALPLLHHRAPDWFPLFRRVHHIEL